jgi:hypothetical protein
MILVSVEYAWLIMLSWFGGSSLVGDVWLYDAVPGALIETWGQGSKFQWEPSELITSVKYFTVGEYSIDILRKWSWWEQTIFLVALDLS